MSDPLYLVTGATGWLGRRLVRALTQGHAEMGHTGKGGGRVRMLVAPGEDAGDLQALGAEAVVGDIRDPASARALTYETRIEPAAAAKVTTSATCWLVIAK